jgi:DNA replication and repair protein RecF
MVEASISCVSTLQLKQFRCFVDQTFHLDAPVVFICGSNGVGKTSLIEALHYACYVRSFRTAFPRELSAHEQDSFFIKLAVRGVGVMDTIQIGCQGAKRLVKVNQKAVGSQKELVNYYRAITVTEDDLGLIKEGPTVRRTFLDQALGLVDAEYVHALRAMRATLEARNAALYSGQFTNELYEVWTQQLWERSVIIQHKRKEFIANIALSVQKIIDLYFENAFSITFSYSARRMDTSTTYAEFITNNATLRSEELRQRRSLFGAHLDDLIIQFHGKDSRQFASRGQQKLIVMLIKIAQIMLLPQSTGPTIMLLDDFMTDLDKARMTILLNVLLNLGIQLIFTSPMVDSYLEQQAKVLCPSTLSLFLD